MPTLTKLFSMEEASQHNSKDDCWVVIDGKVYDVSAYLDDHPGGDDVLLAATGVTLFIFFVVKLLYTENRKDATDEFEDAGHSKDARQQMEKFFIGELEPSSSSIPELEIVKKVSKNIPQKVKDITKQYWFVPVAVVGISVVVGFLYTRKK